MTLSEWPHYLVSGGDQGPERWAPLDLMSCSWLLVIPLGELLQAQAIVWDRMTCFP